MDVTTCMKRMVISAPRKNVVLVCNAHLMVMVMDIALLVRQKLCLIAGLEFLIMIIWMKIMSNIHWLSSFFISDGYINYSQYSYWDDDNCLTFQEDATLFEKMKYYLKNPQSLLLNQTNCSMKYLTLFQSLFKLLKISWNVELYIVFWNQKT